MDQGIEKKFIDGAMNAKSLDDLVQGLVAGQHIFRLDDNVWPTTFRCPIISQGELAQLKKITNVVRMGRVARITEDEVQLENGSYKPDPDTLFIDCTADGLPKREATERDYSSSRRSVDEVEALAQLMEGTPQGEAASRFDALGATAIAVN